jgi:hypothetical protein
LGQVEVIGKSDAKHLQHLLKAFTSGNNHLQENLQPRTKKQEEIIEEEDL